MGIEVERKFLVTGDFKSLSTYSLQIMQGYLSVDPSRVVRIRIKDEKGYITIKGKTESDKISRFEWESEISLVDATSLLKLCYPLIISKTRYIVPWGSFIFEVDEFNSENKGLVIAELETNKYTALEKLPGWIGKEISGMEKYYNFSLSQRPFTTWKGEDLE
jgi:CYTH domain-containing protein